MMHGRIFSSHRIILCKYPLYPLCTLVLKENNISNNISIVITNNIKKLIYIIIVFDVKFLLHGIIHMAVAIFSQKRDTVFLHCPFSAKK